MTQEDVLLELHRAFVSEFSPDDFRHLLLYHTGVRLERITSAGVTFAQVVSEVLQTAERAGWTEELVGAAYRIRPQGRLVRRGGTRGVAEGRTPTRGSRTGRSCGTHFGRTGCQRPAPEPTVPGDAVADPGGRVGRLRVPGGARGPGTARHRLLSRSGCDSHR